MDSPTDPGAETRAQAARRSPRFVILTVQKLRKPVAIALTLMVAPMLLLTAPSWQSPWVQLVTQPLGMLLVGVGVLGRLWAASYNKGHRDKELLRVGPYSLVRHPLYAFSLIATIGIGLLSGRATILLILVSYYAIYYPFVMRAEEHMLTQRFGDEYAAYRARTPAFLPRWKDFSEPETWALRPAKYRRSFGDALGLFVVIPALLTISALQAAGVLPVLARIP